MAETSEEKRTVELQALTRPDLIFPALSGGDRAAVLRELAELLQERGLVHDADELYDSLQEREELGSTALGAGVAVPHCKVKSLEQVVLSVGLSRRGVEFGAPDGVPVRILFLLLSPSDAPVAHLQSLAAISKWVTKGCPCERMIQSDDPEDVYQLLGRNSLG
jgi:PTS system nitrogen regulatory IIA component